MRKSTRIGKRLTALFLVLLLSIESFAATVGDNDGAAFITKAEFDSLKNTFQAQIDQYNSSIDNKIDGAIAGYLSGIKVKRRKVLPILCTNYNLMHWVNDLYVYGWWQKWTSRTTKTEQSNAEWYKPVFDEKRYILGENIFHIYDGIGNGYGYASVHWNILFEEFGPGVTQAEYNTGYNRIPTPALRMAKDDEGWYLVDNYPANLRTVACWKGVPPHFVSQGYNLNASNQVFHKMENLGTAGYFFDVKYYIGAEGSNASYTSHITGDNANFPSYWAYENWPANSPAVFNNQTYAWADNSRVTDGINGGCTYQLIDNSKYTQMNTHLKHLMFGADVNTKANLAKQKEYIYNETTFDMSDSIEETYATGKVNFARETNLSSQGAVEQYIKILPTEDFTIKIPFLPQDYLRNQSTHIFKANKKSLAFGEGLPIIINSSDKGYVHLKFDYDVKDILNDVSKNKKVYLDMKNDSFNSQTASFINGYEGLVDPDQTDKSIKRIERYVDDTGSIELTIPIEKESNLYLRIAPYSTDKDLYASISNLSCIITIE